MTDILTMWQQQLEPQSEAEHAIVEHVAGTWRALQDSAPGSLEAKALEQQLARSLDLFKRAGELRREAENRARCGGGFASELDHILGPHHALDG